MATNKGTTWSKGVGARMHTETESEKKQRLFGEVKEKCSLCGKMFKKKPFERNAFCWVMQHTETPTYEKPSWVCPECKKQLNLFMTKVLMDKKHWNVVEEDK